jgi:cation:H+ antiporter
MPETVIPFIAILFEGGKGAVDVGIGAVAGAPFMLATLAFFVTGLAVVVFRFSGRRPVTMNADPRAFARDLTYFTIVYAAAVATTFLPSLPGLRPAAAVLIFFSYVAYVRSTFAADTGHDSEIDDLLFSTWLRKHPSMFFTVTQLVLSLGVIIFFAHVFVVSVQRVSEVAGVSPLLLSLIITPIATELPEKFNSILWVGKHKDSLALGNISGAMVFQTSVPVAFAMVFTPWDLLAHGGVTLVSAILALVSGVFALAWIRITGKVNPFALMSGGILYAAFVIYLVMK